MMLRALHTADCHYNQENQVPALQSLDVFAQKGIDWKTDVFLIPGDLFDKPVRNTGTSGLSKLQAILKKMLHFAPIAVVYGTPTHDIPGCYEIFKDIEAPHNFVVLQPGEAYFLSVDNQITQNEQPDNKALILGCLEPAKEWLLSDSNLSQEQANEAIKKAMAKLFLGLAALRKKYSSLPCLFLYHGSVTGATLQNGRSVEEGHGLVIGRDDLGQIGAEYYALGHIHLRQKLGDYEMWYPGSIYPVNWGETDTKTFNTIEITKGEEDLFSEGNTSYQVSVDQASFPHPPRRKLEKRINGISIKEVQGFQVWLERIGDKQELATYDRDAVLSEITEYGALPGSRVTTRVIPTETVRAGEIHSVHSLSGKVEIYARNSGEEKLLEETDVLVKCAELEAEGERQGLTTHGAHFQINRMILRGAIGIWKGQGKDEVEIDLDKYDPGIIALMGKNGAGKTTLIENMHPYPTLLTRDTLKLQDHFRLRDSYRDLYFTDTNTGKQYRAFIQIDGQNKTGSVQYHLYEDGQPLVNGRKVDYDEKVQQLFGSLQLFLKSAFISQKPSKHSPDLVEANSNERKRIFNELVGNEYFHAYMMMARERAKVLDGQIHTMETQAATHKEHLAELPSVREELNQKESDINDAKESEIEHRKEVDQLKSRFESLRIQLDDQQRYESQIQARAEEVVKIEGLLGSNEKDLQEYQAAFELKAGVEKDIAEYKKLEKRKEGLHGQSETVRTEYSKQLQEFTNEQQAATGHERTLQAEKASLDKKIAELTVEKNSNLAEQRRLWDFLKRPQPAACPECGYIPSDLMKKHKLEDSYARSKLKEIEVIQSTIEEGIRKYSASSEAIQQDISDIIWPQKPSEPDLSDIKKQIQAVEDDMDFIEIEKARGIYEKALQAEVTIERIQKEIVSNRSHLESLNREIEERKDQLNLEIKTLFDKVKDQYEQKRSDLQAASTQIAVLESEISSHKAQITKLEAKKKILDELMEELETTVKSAAEWRWLETATGPKGIQALELDALSPTISMTANNLLCEAYGTRFQIEFRTTRDGVKNQQEVLDIIIHDSETQTEQEIRTLSGGESVWIRKAIYDAFGIIRAQNTGMKFLTCFQDEADGALDPAAKEQYLKMVEAAHFESGRDKTILITHSQEIQEMIAQRIEIEDLPGPTVEIEQEGAA